MFSKKVKVKHGKDLIKITDRLKNGEVLLMDGGTGSELQRRGVNVLKDATDKLEASSSATSLSDNSFGFIVKESLIFFQTLSYKVTSCLFHSRTHF